MRHHLSSLLAASLLSILATAQEPACMWATSASFDQSASIFTQYPEYIIDADPVDGAVLFGMSVWVKNYSSDSYGRLQLIQYGSDGTVGWQREWSGSGTVSGLRYRADGMLVAMGEYLDSLRVDDDHLFSTSDNFPHAFIVAMDADGMTQWAIDLNEQFTQARRPRAPVFTAEGDLVFGLRSGTSRIVRMDMDGNVLGSITQSPTELHGIDVDAEGNLYVTGSCASSAGATFNGTTYVPGVSGNGYNRYLVRYRPDGTPAWARFSGDVTCTTSEVRQDGAGALYWAGLLFAEADFDTYHIDGPTNGSTPDFHLCKLDTAGNYLWVREGPDGNGNGAGPGLQQYLALGADGTILLAGTGKGTLAWDEGITVQINGASDPLLMGFDPDGTLHWCIHGDSNDQFDKAHGLGVGADGSIYITGVSRQTIAFGEQVIPITSNINTPFVVRYGYPSTSVAPVDRGEVVIHPVPATDRLFVSSGGSVRVMACMDALGRSVEVRLLNGSIDISALQPGTYMLTLEERGARRSVHRFVKH